MTNLKNKNHANNFLLKKCEISLYLNFYFLIPQIAMIIMNSLIKVKSIVKLPLKVLPLRGE